MNKSVLVFLLLLLSMSACKSKRKLSADGVGTDSALLASADQRFQQLLLHDFMLTELSMNGGITVDMNDQRLSSPMSLKMQKDQQIWISVKPMLGIEAFRVLIRPDSIFVVDRLNKQYLQKPFAWLSEMAKAPFTYATLQDLLLNNVGFLTRGNRLVSQERQLQLSLDGLRYLLQPDATGNKLKGLEVIRPDQKLRVDFIELVNFEGKQLPKSLKLIIEGKESGTIDINFSKFAVENGQTYPFSIPSSYTRID
ncbi:MAG: DUF4292 domain-containing protein [Sphingobacteriaceae bacterium]|nr:DUF4292 domain-containing protein [Sphingobacteriaceae bacterium]